MARWNKGSEVIKRLLEDRHLEEVPADAETVDRLIATARRHLASATTNADSDPEGALALAYDASRKAATELLAHQGLRPTSAGGHISVVDAINAQVPGVEGLKSIDRLRRRRNQAEYPDPRNYDPVTRRSGRRHRRGIRLCGRRREAPLRAAARAVPLAQAHGPWTVEPKLVAGQVGQLRRSGIPDFDDRAVGGVAALDGAGHCPTSALALVDNDASELRDHAA